MDVAGREKFLTTRFEPTVAGVGLTLRAVPVPAAVVGDGRTVRAVGALIEMPAQGGGATARDGAQHLEVLPGDPFTAAFDESASRGANQIGHLEWWPVHHSLCGTLPFSWSESRGLAVALRCRCERWR